MDLCHLPERPAVPVGVYERKAHLSFPFIEKMVTVFLVFHSLRVESRPCERSSHLLVPK